MRLYTKSGDAGTTGLMYGKRVSKDNFVVEAFCCIDEIVACTGIIRSYSDEKTLDLFLIEIQEKCFRLGTFITTDPKDREKLDMSRSSIYESDVKDLEIAIDQLCETFEMPTTFVHPGGNKISASCDLARVTARRCEIQVAKTASIGWIEVENYGFAWLNRLSDYFFALARSLEEKRITREKPDV